MQKTKSEHALYSEFVNRSLLEVRNGLKLDNYAAGSKKRSVFDTLETWNRKKQKVGEFPAAKTVIEGRFILGGDDSAYIASGLSVLWSTVGCNEADKSEDELALAPATLYSPDSLNGIRQGLIVAFEKSHNELRDQAPETLTILLSSFIPMVNIFEKMGDFELSEKSLKNIINDLKLKKTLTEMSKTEILKFLIRVKRICNPMVFDSEHSLAGMLLKINALSVEVTRHKHSEGCDAVQFKDVVVEILLKAENKQILESWRRIEGDANSIDNLDRPKLQALRKQLESLIKKLDEKVDEITKKQKGEEEQSGNSNIDQQKTRFEILTFRERISQYIKDVDEKLMNSSTSNTMTQPEVVSEYPVVTSQPSPRRFGSQPDPYNWVESAILRGLVGQRGPTETATLSDATSDKELPYTLPSAEEMVQSVLPAHLLVQSIPDATESEVEHAISKCQGETPTTFFVDSPATIIECVALFQDNVAMIGKTPASDLPEVRCGVEVPHEVRWIPQGPRAVTMAKVAVLEHAIARCKQICDCEKLKLSSKTKNALLHAATSLKMQQMEPLYELHEAVEFQDDPHPLGTTERFVTRPCAIVRGTLSFSTEAGVELLCDDHVCESSLTHDASLAQDMKKNAAATASLRNNLRRRGLSSNIYVAPPSRNLAFIPAPKSTGTPGGPSSGGNPLYGSEMLSSKIHSFEEYRKRANQAILALAAIQSSNNGADSIDAVDAFIDLNKNLKNGEVTAQTRRDGLWTEMHRHSAISQDRLWVFIRLLGGCIGGNVSEVITMADDATLKTAKAIQDQRLEIAKRVTEIQSKIVETVVSSMLKNSTMTMNYSAENKNIAVIDAEAKKELSDLASGVSGRPFFEANVALKNLTHPKGTPPSLQEVLSGLANVGSQMQTNLESTLIESNSASVSLVELSHPSNSYFVSMRPDALAAIRGAHEKLNCELSQFRSLRRLSLWELVEGGCEVLTHRFAELCGFILVQSRSSTGVSAMYVSHQSMYTNAQQARVSLARLTSVARVYAMRVPAPDFECTYSETSVSRSNTLTSGERVRDIDIARTR